jgi:single-strand DNA-binding protein
VVAKLTLVGNLGVDPEVRYTPDGKMVVTCRVASNYRKRAADNREWVDATNWYRVTVFGRLAERMSEQASSGRLTKGTRIIVWGRLEASGYLDRGNQPQPSLDVIADDVLLADSSPRRGESEDGAGDHESSGGGGGEAPMRPQQRRPSTDEPADLEDLPF